MAAGNGRGDRAGPPPAGGGTRVWWWLPVLAIALVVAVILVRGGNGEEGGPAAVPETPSLEPAEPAETGTGSITIGGEEAEPLLASGDLSEHVGEEVLGTLIPVDSVIAEGVLWVGEDRAQVLLLEPEGAATAVRPGELVTFRGTLEALDDDTRNAVWGAEAERRLEAQGAYVAVNELAVGEP